MFLRKKYLGAMILLLSLSFFPDVSSQNINDALRVTFPGLGSSARALGMGNSYIGLSDDASAAFYNPAGFGLIKRLEFSGGLDYLNYNNEASLFRNSSSYSNSSTKLSRLSFAFPFPTMRGSLVLGIAYHNVKDLTGALKFDGFNNAANSMIQDLLNTDVPFDLYLTDDTGYNTIINGRLNQSGTVNSSGDINNWTFSGAVELQKNLFVGANLNIITGSYDYKRDYYEDDTQNLYTGETAPGYPLTKDFRTFYLNNILEWKLSGWDAKVGFIYQFNPFSRFGLTIQFPKTFTIEEKFLVSGQSEFGTGTIYKLDREKYSDKVKYDIITPFELAGGFSLNMKGLILNAEATLIDYSQTEFDRPEGLTDIYIAQINSDIKDKLTVVLNLNAGLEYTIPVIGLRLRGGYFVQPSPYKDDPKEFDRKYVTGGVGFLADETISIDLGYAHGWWKDIGDNYGYDVSRTFQDITVDKIILSFGYRF